MTTFRGRAAMLCATVGLLFLMTGCGALSAMANPKVAWAIGDPAPMSVVVRRADAAEGTAREVDRLLTATPANPDSDWLKSVGPKPEEAAGHMKALSQHPFYAQSHARVVAAEAWLRALEDVQSTDGSSPNLLSMVSSDLGDQYAAIIAKEQEIARLDAQIALEKQARDKKDASDADKKAHDQTIDDLEAQKSKKEDEVDPLKAKFVAAAKDAAGKTPADARDAVGPALVNLRQAVEDASIADGAAAVRYPLALQSMVDSVKAVVPEIVADLVEEQTGTRPSMQRLHPDVTLDGLEPKITLDGLSASDLGKIGVGELTTQTVVRTKDWLVHTVALLAAISATKDHLSFEEDTLDAMLDGFAKNGWTRVAAATIPEATDPKVASAAPKAHPHKRPASSPAVGVAEAQASKVAPPAAASPAKRTSADRSSAAATRAPAHAPRAPRARPAPRAAAAAPAASAPPGGHSTAPMRPDDFNP